MNIAVALAYKKFACVSQLLEGIVIVLAHIRIVDLRVDLGSQLVIQCATRHFNHSGGLMAAIGVSQTGSVYDPSHGLHAHTVLRAFGSPNETTTVKLGSAAAFKGADPGIDRVVGTHGAATAFGGVQDSAARSAGSGALEALRHADSFVGSAGAATYSISGSVVHDRIFAAAFSAAHVDLQAAAAPGALGTSSGTAGHTLFTLGESTTVSVKDVTPTLGGGHFK